MTQPEYVPVRAGDEIRPVERLPAPGHWKASRPGDLRPGVSLRGVALGDPGPDQGYALQLAKRFHGKLVLTEGEVEHDVIDGCLGVAMKRASMFGRAPVLADLEVAFNLWGYLDEAPEDLVAHRRPLFSGAGHHYWDQRILVGSVPERVLRMTPAQVKAAVQADWGAVHTA
ncbi:MAG TPA: hypothetical protein VFP54_04620 [Acidimicrobiales bacterium]|nr:hypothetical protein [Acidimicrobiales bacterium]